MTSFAYRGGVLHAESVSLESIAKDFGTPCYVYSRAALEAAYADFAQGCAGRDALVCYAVKANSNLAILNLFARLGAGFDIVSGGELKRVLAAGAAASKTVFSGVGKTEGEMRDALEAGILCFNVESEAELLRLDRVARSLGQRAPVSLRVNPDIDPGTHPYIATGQLDNKFGVPIAEALPLYRTAAGLAGLRLTGIDCHIGSQLLETGPLVAALERVLALADRLDAEGIHLEHLDLGGGLGIRYRDERPPELRDYLDKVFSLVGQRELKLIFEPGRLLVGNAGVLLTRVEYLKHGPARSFAVVDAAMNDLLRPALYEAWHDILAVRVHAGEARVYDVVGPVCESGDFLGRDRSLALAEGDLLAVMSAGAYGMTMSSNYNTRARPAEVIVQHSNVHLVRERERLESLFALERVLP